MLVYQLYVKYGTTMDPADAFAMAYDQLAALRPGARELDAWVKDPVKRAAWQETTAAMRDTGQVPDRLLLNSRGCALLGVTSAVDRVLSLSSPMSNSQESIHRRLRSRFLRSGRFNLEADGAVLPRYVDAGRPKVTSESLDEVYRNVRVSQQTWTSCIQVNLHSPELQNLDVVVPRSRTIRVAQLPLAGPGDVLLRHLPSQHGGHLYTAAPGPALLGRVPAAMHRLRDSKASIALIPEATLDDGILEAWRAARNPDNPTWVLVGSGPVLSDYRGASAPPGLFYAADGTRLVQNRAVLLHGGTGEIIAVQDKRYGFTILSVAKDTYRLGGAPDEAMDEGIVPGKKLTIIESRLGRVAILICEDLDHLVQDGQALRELGVSLVLVPVVAPPILRHGWQHKASEALAKDVGCGVITVNSLALGREEVRVDQTTGAVTGRLPATTLQIVVPIANSYKAARTAVSNPNSASCLDEQDALTVRSAVIQVP